MTNFITIQGRIFEEGNVWKSPDKDWQKVYTNISISSLNKDKGWDSSTMKLEYLINKKETPITGNVIVMGTLAVEKSNWVDKNGQHQNKVFFKIKADNVIQVEKSEKPKNINPLENPKYDTRPKKLEMNSLSVDEDALLFEE